MSRIFVAFLAFFFLFVFQTSFIHALPGWLMLLPVFFAVSVYFTQHHSLAIGAIWLSAYGIMLDLLHINHVPLEFISYSAAGLVALVLSRRLFSNRSLWGVLACGAVSSGTLFLFHVLILFVVQLRAPEHVAWNTFLNESLVIFLSLLLLLFLLFQFAGSFRTILIKSFLLSKKHETF